MNGMHLYLWHYWNVAAYFGCLLFLAVGIGMLWRGAKLVNLTWAARNGGKVFTYALFSFLFPAAFLFFNAGAAQRIVERGSRSLEDHVYQLQRNALCNQLLDLSQGIPPGADAQRVNREIFRGLCRYVQEQSVMQKNALPLPRGIGDQAVAGDAELQRFFHDGVFRNRSYPAQLDSLVTEARTKQINRAVTAYLCTAAWEQNEEELRAAASPPWGFIGLWCFASLCLTMGRAYRDIKKIYPYPADTQS